MMKIKFLLLLGVILALPVMAQNKANLAYPYDPATRPDSSVRAGEILKRQFTGSSIYPGTTRTYWIYIPAAYDPQKPACLYVNMDGIQFNAPTVFDHLIATGEMPVTIGVFVGSGNISDSTGMVLRFNRSNEFDRTDDTFVRFLLDELLPDVEKQKTGDGRAIRFSKDGNDRAIAGASSGAICAFTAAWERPDAFSRVFSAIGTYVAMRGGNDYPALIRKTEPKPLRIYLEDGIEDAWNPLFGYWFEANRQMEMALNFAGYEVTHTWGRGGHDGIEATAIFPDAMRWLWKGWPAKVKRGTSLNDMLTAILPGDSGWEEINQPYSPASDLFSDKDGNILFMEPSGQIISIDTTNTITPVMKLKAGEFPAGTSGTEFYIVNSKGTIVARGKGQNRTVATGLPGVRSILRTPDQNLYLTQATGDQGKIWLITTGGDKRMLSQRQYGGTYLALYPNHRLLMQTEQHSQWIYSYVIGDKGTLTDGERFYWLHNSENFSFDQNGNMTFDNKGNLWVATDMGVQVCDQNGRVRAILTLPTGKVTSLAFGGKNHDILYSVSDGRIFRRRMKVSGMEPWMPAMKPVSQGGG